MTDLIALRRTNGQRWANASLARNFSSVAGHLVSPGTKSRYQVVSAKAGVSWVYIAAIQTPV